MYRKSYMIIGVVLLFIIGGLWITNGFSSYYFVLGIIATLCLSIGDGTIKEWEIVKRMSSKQVLTIVVSFLLSVAIVFGLIQFSNYVISVLLQLEGKLKTTVQIVLIIVCLYPVKFLFATIVYKVIHNEKP